MRRQLFIFLLLAPAVLAQPTVAPTNAPVGGPRGEDVGGYNITNSWELGYRFHDVNGNRGKYRSDVNFGNGIRLLGSRLTIHSKEGHGSYFDELLLNTQGLGNDPYQMSTLRLQKNRIYRYDMLWRENEYFNPALTISRGEHLLDTQRRLQDHTLTLLPQAPIKLFLGYSRNTQDGAGFTTLQVFDARGDEFPLFSNVSRSQNEYRIGGELQLSGIKLSFLRGWENFKDDTREPSVALPAGNNPTDLTALTSFRRDQPYHGNTKNWLVHLLADRSRWWAANGRFTYAEGRRSFIFDELAIGTDRFGSGRNRQIVVNGDARRPVSSANLTLSFFPAQQLTITNHTGFHHTRMEGDGLYRELSNSLLDFSTVRFQFLGIRAVSNATDFNFRPAGRIGLYGGYRFSTRRVRSIEQETFDSIPERVFHEQDNTLHSGLFGIRIRPVKPLTILLDAEIGRADMPFYPISERNYHLLGARIQYRGRSFSLTALARSNYNTNSVTLSSHSSRSRQYGIDGSWTPRTWFALDAGYQKLHLDTLSGVAYFQSGALVNGQSLYISNIHAANAGARFGIGRTELFLGYNRVQDVGSDRIRVPRSPTAFLVAPLSFQWTYPLSFDSPQARLSVRLHQNFRWNLGYQFYRYREDVFVIQNYRAHTGFTSVSWSF